MKLRPAFEAQVLPHLDAAYNLARWLLRDDASAEDAVQEAVLRALRYFDKLREGDARPWLLAIVRNTCWTLLERRRGSAETVEFADSGFESPAPGPEALLQRERTRQEVDAAIRALPPLLREVIVLREFEDLDYATIARIAAVPIGTVMSRLARARAQLRLALTQQPTGAANGRS